MGEEVNKQHMKYIEENRINNTPGLFNRENSVRRNSHLEHWFMHPVFICAATFVGTLLLALLYCWCNPHVREQEVSPGESNMSEHDIEAPETKQELRQKLFVKTESIMWNDSPWMSKKVFLSKAVKRGIKPRKASIAFEVIQNLHSPVES